MIYTAKEDKILKEVSNRIDCFKNSFKEKNLTYKVQLKRGNLEFGSEYMSEIEIEFYLNHEFFDIIEFFVFYKGNFYPKQIYLEELETDFKDILQSI